MAHEFKDDTLDDIKHRDIFNLETFLKKKGRTYKTWEDQDKALEFMGARVSQILATIGLSIERSRVDDTYDIDKVMKERGVKVESRIYDEKIDPEDEWRSGVYIYKDNEIAGFVGYPIYNPRNFKGYQIMYTVKL
jgi:hypothetical protein